MVQRLRASLSAKLSTSLALDCRHRRKEQERRGGSSGVWECGGDKWKYKEKNRMENTEKTAIKFQMKQVDEEQNIKKCGRNRRKKLRRIMGRRNKEGWRKKYRTS